MEFECSSSPPLPDDGTDEAAEDGDSIDTQSEEDDADGDRIFPRIRASVLKGIGGDSELYGVKDCSRTHNDDDDDDDDDDFVVVVVEDDIVGKDDKGKRNATEVLESATTATRPASAAVDSTDSGDDEDDEDGKNKCCRLHVTIVLVVDGRFMLWRLRLARFDAASLTSNRSKSILAVVRSISLSVERERCGAMNTKNGLFLFSSTLLTHLTKMAGSGQ